MSCTIWRPGDPYRGPQADRRVLGAGSLVRQGLDDGAHVPQRHPLGQQGLQHPHDDGHRQHPGTRSSTSFGAVLATPASSWLTSS